MELCPILRKTLVVAIDAHIYLPAVDLGSVHHPAGLLCTLLGIEPHCPTALGLPVLHLDLCKHHLTCGDKHQGTKMSEEVVDSESV